jgi:RNA polymerase sigma-70 factor (ECF subfamily)
MDPALLGSLIDRFASALELYARQWCDAPEDVVQEAFVKLSAQRATPLRLEAWLFKAVRNGAINAGIAQRRRRSHETNAAAQAARWFETDKPRHALAVDLESAQAALAALPLEQREVVIAHIWAGLTFEQIAEVSGTSTSAAHRAYQTGLKSLRERLGVPCRANPSRPVEKK